MNKNINEIIDRLCGIVIAVCSGKGGVGKTTTTVKLAKSLAVFGKKVLIINLDVLDNATQYLGLVGVKRPTRTIEDYYTYSSDPKREDNNRVVHGLSTICYHDDTTSFNILTVRDSCDIHDITDKLLQDVINSAKQEFDYILVDAPVGIDLGFIKAVVVADVVVGVVNNEVASIRDLDMAFTTVNKMYSDKTKYMRDGVEYKTNAKSTYFMLNRVDPELTTIGLKQTLHALSESTTANPLGYVIENKKVMGDNNLGISGARSSAKDVDAAYIRMASRILDINLTKKDRLKLMLESWEDKDKKQGFLGKMIDKIIH